MVEGTRPGLTLPEATQAGDRCNKAATRATDMARKDAHPLTFTTEPEE